MRVVHCKKEPYDVYIGRPSKWGNPFTIGKDGNREQVINAYRKWINDSPELLYQIHELEGKTLGCWCSPKACHGDVLIELVNEMKELEGYDKWFYENFSLLLDEFCIKDSNPQKMSFSKWTLEHYRDIQKFHSK